MKIKVFKSVLLLMVLAVIIGCVCVMDSPMQFGFNLTLGLVMVAFVGLLSYGVCHGWFNDVMNGFDAYLGCEDE